MEVDYFDVIEMQTRLRDLLRYYRALHLNRTEEHGMDAAALDTITTQADLAEHIFKTMFRSPDLSALLNESEESSLTTLLRWQDASASTRSSGSCVYTTQEQCSDALSELSSERRPSDVDSEVSASAWPYIKKIRYAVSSSFRRVSRSRKSCRLTIGPQNFHESTYLEQGTGLGRSTRCVRSKPSAAKYLTILASRAERPELGTPQCHRAISRGERLRRDLRRLPHRTCHH